MSHGFSMSVSLRTGVFPLHARSIAGHPPPTTRTGSPSAISSSDFASQITPWVDTCPDVPGLIELSLASSQGDLFGGRLFLWSGTPMLRLVLAYF